MSRIETRLFGYFVALAEEHHFARAAERLGITQPTLSHQIKKLERDLGVKLLQRKSNRTTAVTAAGQRFLAHARDVLQRVDEAEAIARQAGRGELGRLELGFVISMSSAGLLQSWISEFRQARPGIDIAINELTSMEQINGIVRNELDAGFARMPHKYPSGIRGFEVYRQRTVLALPSDHRLARHKTISPAMLAAEPFVSTTPELDLGFSGHTEAIAGLGKFVPRVVKRHRNFIAVLSYVGLGYGIAVVPALLKTTGVANVVFRDIATDPVPQTSIAFVYGSDPSPSAKLLMQYMRRHAVRNHGSGAAPPTRSAGQKGVPKLVFSRKAS